jgi:hypothetical protein
MGARRGRFALQAGPMPDPSAETWSFWPWWRACTGMTTVLATRIWLTLMKGPENDRSDLQFRPSGGAAQPGGRLAN